MQLCKSLGPGLCSCVCRKEINGQSISFAPEYIHSIFFPIQQGRSFIERKWWWWWWKWVGSWCSILQQLSLLSMCCSRTFSKGLLGWVRDQCSNRSPAKDRSSFSLLNHRLHCIPPVSLCVCRGENNTLTVYILKEMGEHLLSLSLSLM